MARKQKEKQKRALLPGFESVHADTKRSIYAVLLFVVTFILILAALGSAGVAGGRLFSFLTYLFGIGYYLIPALAAMLGISLLRGESAPLNVLKGIGALVVFICGLGLIDIFTVDRGGLIGGFVSSPLTSLFDTYASIAILGALSVIALLVLMEARLTLSSLIPSLFRTPLRKNADEKEMAVHTFGEDDAEEGSVLHEESVEEGAPEEGLVDVEVNEEEGGEREAERPRGPQFLAGAYGTYTPPPLSLFERDRGKPGVGDIKANANIIKRTLQNFGIRVEMDEVSIGPTVARYALKPAEGVRLSKIVGLQNNLELALAAHPVRIEAPIPGKSLVGIEVPNTTKSLVGLATLLSSAEYTSSDKPLLLALGRTITGSPLVANLGKMPHVLIAGATGSGKSVTIHSLIASLIYRNSPDMLRFIFIDPKRVELTLYNGIPHLLTPVVTDAKKTILTLKWAAREMDRRYDVCEAEKVRDIDSYHHNVLAPALQKAAESGEAPTVEAMPYIVIIIDELADIMQTYPRELEAAVVRLAQMSRAVGIHLILSTQRPSVNVITGLIKANIPSRVALQVASQIDSRTILDTGGAEKLLGAGDMLYLSGDMGKPVRIQAPYLSEAEVKKVVKFLKDNNEPTVAGIVLSEETLKQNGMGTMGDEEEIDDDLYEEARVAVEEAGKASTSYLQRKLRIGYSRAARLMDLLEERGVIGGADGSKPREVLSRQGGFGKTPENEEV